MIYELNPFLKFSIYELEIAYVVFTQDGDTEAIDWVIESFCLQATLEFN